MSPFEEVKAKTLPAPALKFLLALIALNSLKRFLSLHECEIPLPDLQEVPMPDVIIFKTKSSSSSQSQF